MTRARNPSKVFERIVKIGGIGYLPMKNKKPITVMVTACYPIAISSTCKL